MSTHPVARSVRWACLPALLLAAGLQAAVYTVGPPGTAGNCTHGSIQAAIDAAAANPGDDEIRIANNQTWSNQALVIADQGLRITGGFGNCFPLAPTGQTRLSGAGGVAAPVIAIANDASAGREVWLERLEIVGGDAADAGGDGGGLRWQGPGLLVLQRVRLADNRGQSGGGLLVANLSPLSMLVAISARVQIEDNVAIANGGGVHLYGSNLMLGGPETTIRRNSARTGGGLFATSSNSPTWLSIASGGLDDDGIIAGNSGIDFGGGLHVAGAVNVTLYTSDPLRPVRIERNGARYGGGIYAANGPHIDMWEALVSGNTASVDGAALYLNGASASAGRVPSVAAPPEAVPCAAGQTCNLWYDNRAIDAGGQPVGAAVARLANLVGVPTELVMHSAVIRGNQGRSLFRDRCPAGMTSCDVSLHLIGSELVGNPTPAVAEINYGAGVYIDLSTLAGFGVGPAPLFDMGSGILSLSRSILWQPGQPVLGSPTVLNASFLLLHDSSGFPNSPDIRSGDPRFLNPGIGDWRPGPDSPALDSAPAIYAPSFDLGRAARVVDLPQVANLAGPVDLGAWEQPLVDRIFAHGFESPPSTPTGGR